MLDETADYASRERDKGAEMGIRRARDRISI